MSSRISVVDLAGGELKVAQALSDAFADTGFAVITSSGIPSSTVAELRAAALEWFQSPVEVKQKANAGASEGYGHSPYCRMEENGAQLLGDFSKPNDLVESLTYRPEDGLMLPHSPRLEAAVKDFGTCLPVLQKALGRSCELALGLELGFFEARQSRKESLRLAFYPELQEPPLEGQMRYGAHVDSFGLTILNLDPQNPGGLQVRLGEDHWVDVPFVEDSFVLNVGALLSRWTNGYWKASVHRVLLVPGQRLSIVAGALRPHDDVLLEALGPSAGKTEDRLPPVLAGDFCQERVELHRPSYLEQKGLQGADGTQQLSEDIRAYRQ